MLVAFPSNPIKLLATNSADIEDSTAQDLLLVEVLQSFKPLSLPPSRLLLKEGALVILLQNLYPKQGLYNGTRLAILRISPQILKARILLGKFASQLRLILQIKLTSTDSKLLFIVTQVQFSLRLSFTITINKSQSQLLSIAGVDLRYFVFTHGQLYVIISRVTTITGLCVLLLAISSISFTIEASCNVINIIYSKVLLLQIYSCNVRIQYIF